MGVDLDVDTPFTRVAESWDGTQLLAALHAAARWLEHHTDTLNALNVFPVPDGDTGTNMVLTLRGALAKTTPHPSCAVVADQVRYGALMCGRGNSGIILSQVLGGMALGMAGHDQIGSLELAQALVQARVNAYQAVMKPVEGTMLTVIREASVAASAAAAAGESLTRTLEATVHAAWDAVRRSPGMLRTLREAGVVDSGGQGLALLFVGMMRYARGEPTDALEESLLPQAAVAHEAFAAGYCTNFVLEGRHLPFEDIRAGLAEFGESLVVAGDHQLMKVHLHALRPGDVLNYAMTFGALSQIDISSMDAQAVHANVARMPAEAPLSVVGLVAVATGQGFSEILRGLGVDAVLDGAAMPQPNAAALADAIEKLPQAEVIVLPNGKDWLPVAHQAARLSAKRVAIVPSQTVPQGIAAAAALRFRADLAANEPLLLAAIVAVRTAEITRATRDATYNGIVVHAGQTIGLLEGEPVVAHDSLAMAIDLVLEQMQLDECELISVYYGYTQQQASAADVAERVRARYPHLEVEVLAGGQTVVDFIFAAE